MIGWIRLFLAPPVFEGDEDKTRTAALLNTISIGLAASAFVVSVAPLPGLADRRHIFFGSAVVVALAAHFLMRRGFVRAGGVLLVAGTWLIVLLSCLTAGGVYAPANRAFILPVMCASLLFGFRAAMWTTGATTVAGLLMFVAGVRGLLPIPSWQLSPAVNFSSQLMFLVVLALLLRVSTQSIRDSLERAREELAERQRAQEALRRSEGLLGDVINNSSAVIYAKGTDGRYLMVNKACERFARSSAENIIGKTDYDIFSEETAESFRQNDLEVIAAGGAIESEHRGLGSDGLQTYVSIKFPLVDSAGALYGVCGIATDISDRKRSEAEARASEERFSKAFNASPAPMSILKGLRFIEVNEALLRITGYAREEVVGRTALALDLFQDLGDPDRMGALLAHNGTVRDMEVSLRMKNGQIRTHLISADSIDLGGERCMLIVGIDISERKVAEEALRESEASFREFFEDSLTGDYISSPAGKLLACNREFVRMFGFGSVEEALECDTRLLYPHPGKREEYLGRLRDRFNSAGRLERLESEFRRRDGVPLFVVQNAIGVFDENGELIQMRGYMFDVTERRTLEQQLLQSQKMEAIGRLAGGVAHDFNNLLCVVLSYSDLLLLPSNRLPDALGRYVEEIKNAGERAAALTRQLLAFSRQQVLHVRVIDLNQVIAGILQILDRLIGEDIVLRTARDAGEALVKADGSQLEQVLVNLAVNARDAMPNGGRLTIETANVTLDECQALQLEDLRPGPYVVLSVSDTGTGMDEATRAHIFEPFFTTKEMGKGTGLGLATVHGIVSQSGGHIRVYSEPGHGSAFKIYLPDAQSQEIQPEPEHVQPAAFTGSETILLVEDGREVREIARRILETNGYKVLTANAEDAVQMCGEFPGAIHLLLTDVVMPKINGCELAEQLTELRPAMKVLYMSGYPDMLIKDRGILPPGVAFLGKPFTLTGLAEKVREVLDGS